MVFLMDELRIPQYKEFGKVFSILENTTGEDRFSEKTRKIAGKYHIENQTLQLAEECVELTKEALKTNRNKAYFNEEQQERLVDEMADVLVMIEQMIRLYGLSHDKIAERINQKVDRQIKRMEWYIYDGN